MIIFLNQFFLFFSMLNFKETFQGWMRDLIEENPNVLKNPEGIVNHIGDVYDNANAIFANIKKSYPNLPIATDEIAIAAGLHDIGRPVSPPSQIFHELYSANWIEQNGLEKGIAKSQKDIYRIAQMVRSHGFTYEFWTDELNKDSRKKFEPLDLALTVQRTWQEAIITYADLTSMGGERVTVQEILDDVYKRYSDDTKFKSDAFANATVRAYPRMLEIAERVEALEQGKLTEADIARYGFL